MTILETILADLLSTSLSYKGMRVDIFGIPKYKSRNYGSLRTTIYRLHRDGLIDKNKDGWAITQKGKEYAKKKFDSLAQFESPFPKDASKDLLVIFDIPETQKSEREWFRRHLKRFDYEMIQRSVWVGPSPLPKEFVAYTKEIGLKNTIKTFKLAKNYSPKQK